MMKNKIFLLIVLLIGQGKLFSCTCIGEESVKDAIKNANYVFIGKCVAVTELVVDSFPPLIPIVTIKKDDFEVITLYKGRSFSKIVSVYTGDGGGDCGFLFEIGKEYIIYAKWRNRYFPNLDPVPKFLYTNICQRTTVYSDYEKFEIEKCRKPKKKIG